MRRKRKGGPFGIFQHSCCPVAKHEQIEGGPFGELFFQKMSHKAKKTEKVDPLVSPGVECYAEKAPTKNEVLISSKITADQFAG